MTLTKPQTITVLFISLILFVLSITISISHSINNIFINTQIKYGEIYCLNTPYPFPQNIITNNENWEIQKRITTSNTEIPNITCIQQKDQNVPPINTVILKYKVTDSIQIPIARIQIDVSQPNESFSEPTTDSTSYSIMILNALPDQTYYFTDGDQKNNCDVIAENLQKCTYQYKSNASIQNLKMRIIRNWHDTEFTEIYSSLITISQNKQINTIFQSNKADKTFCNNQTECTLGSSIQGREIMAYIFGAGKEKIVLFGAIHGRERNTSELMYQLIYAINNKNIVIPSDKQLIIIPILNIDGYQTEQRLNANQVDLNRNYNTKDWKQITYLTDAQTFPNGGGITPASEPETQIISNLLSTIKPIITISYHSWGGYVMPNFVADKTGIPQAYSKLSQYVFSKPTNEKSAGFNYDVTGTIETWGDENNIAIMTVELSDLTSHDFEKNVGAFQMLLSE